MASREIMMLVRPGIRIIGRYKVGIKEVVSDVTTLAGATMTGVEVYEKVKHKSDNRKDHTELDVKEVKVDGGKHDDPVKTNGAAATTNGFQHHSMFSELDLKNLPHSRTIHLIEVVGGVERAFEVEINVLKEVDLFEIVGQEEVLDEAKWTV